MVSCSALTTWESRVDQKLDYLRTAVDNFRVQADALEKMQEMLNKQQEEQEQRLRALEARVGEPAGQNAVDEKLAEMERLLLGVNLELSSVEVCVKDVQSEVEALRPQLGQEEDKASECSSNSSCGMTTENCEASERRLTPQKQALELFMKDSSRWLSSRPLPEPSAPLAVSLPWQPATDERAARDAAVSGCEGRPFVRTPRAEAADGKVLASFTCGQEEMCFRHLGQNECLEGVVVKGGRRTTVELTQPGFAMYTPDGFEWRTALANQKCIGSLGAHGDKTLFKLMALEKSADDKKKSTQGDYTLFAMAAASECRLEQFAKQHPGEVVAALVLDEEEAAAAVSRQLGADRQADGTVRVYMLLTGCKLEGKVEHHAKAGRLLINIDPHRKGHQVGVWADGSAFRSRNTVLPDARCPTPPTDGRVLCSLAAHGGAILAAWAPMVEEV